MADMIDIDDFLPFVLRFAPNMSDLVAYRGIRDASRQLCEAVEIWRERDVIDVDGSEAAVCTIPDADIVKISAARFNGERLEPKAVAWLDANRPGWDEETELQDSSNFITQVNRNHIRLSPPVAGQVSARLILKPSISAETLPAVLLSDFATEIGRGAAGLILIEPGDESNPQLGAEYLGMFQTRINKLKIDAAKGQQGARLRSKGRYF